MHLDRLVVEVLIAERIDLTTLKKIGRYTYDKFGGVKYHQFWVHFRPWKEVSDTYPSTQSAWGSWLANGKQISSKISGFTQEEAARLLAVKLPKSIKVIASFIWDGVMLSTLFEKDEQYFRSDRFTDGSFKVHRMSRVKIGDRFGYVRSDRRSNDIYFPVKQGWMEIKDNNGSLYFPPKSALKLDIWVKLSDLNSDTPKQQSIKSYKDVIAGSYAITIDEQGKYFALQSKENSLLTIGIKSGKVIDIGEYAETLQHFCFDQNGKLRIKKLPDLPTIHCFSDDGSILGMLLPDNTLTFVDLNSGELISEVKNQGDIVDILISPKNDIAAVIDSGNHCQLIALSPNPRAITGKHRLGGATDPIRDLAFNSSGTQLAVISAMHVSIIDTELNDLIATKSVAQGITTICFRDNDDLLLGYDDGRVLNHDRDADTITELFQLGVAPIKTIAITPDGTKAVFINENGIVYLKDIPVL